jgi:putative ABC transport system substrate-binding protein
MKRREFIAGLGGAAAWPLAARAQQRAMPVIGFLSLAEPDGDPDRLRGFRQGLKETGYVEGDNVSIVYRWAEPNQVDRLPALAADLVRRQVTMIATSGVPSALAAKAATTSIPIVFVVGDDPIRQGLVASLARPGSNLTGINFITGELAAKRLELIRELVPGATRVGVIAAVGGSAETVVKDVQAAASIIGLQIQMLRANNSREIDEAFATLGRERPDIIFVGGGPFYASRRVQIVQLSAHYRLPASYAGREFAEVGGLMSYGGNTTDAFRQAGAYAGRILKGMKPSDLPVMQATKLELVINHQTARMLGVTVPPLLLTIADEVIE